MRGYLKTTVRLSSVALLMAFVAACTSVDVSREFTNAHAVQKLDDSGAPFGAKIAFAEAGFTTRVDGLRPYFASR